MKLSIHDSIGLIIHQTDLTITSCVKSKLAPFNLAPEQNLIIMLLWEKDGLNQNEIAEELKKDKTNIARMLFNLELKGFIRRVTGDNDRRSLVVYLTEDGKALANRVAPIVEELKDIMCQGISKEEQMELRRILLKICANVQLTFATTSNT